MILLDPSGAACIPAGFDLGDLPQAPRWTACW